MSLFANKIPTQFEQNIVLVCGGRDFLDQVRLYNKMDGQHRRDPIDILVAGDAPGADTLAIDWATTRGVQLIKFPANWKRYGKGGGSHRNQFQFDWTKPKKVIAFPGGPGTGHMVNYAARQGVRVIKVRERIGGIHWFDHSFEWLSNFYWHPVWYEGQWYPSNEHAYQAAKSDSPKIRLQIAQADSPGKAKYLGRKVKLVPNWDRDKPDVMRTLVRQKFRALNLREKLITTKHLPLIEMNTWKDVYWGVCEGVGLNMLGKILEETRLEAQCFGTQALWTT